MTTTGGPRFRALDGGTTGIVFAPVRDEGVLFFDHDLDGDQDLLLLLAATRNVLFENRGDGTFVEDTEAIGDQGRGVGAGCSAADWDLDGDLDLTTTEVFRRNLLIETGTPFLRLATHSITGLLLGQLTPAWGDWDKDGDLDCALGNAPFAGAFLQNTTYDAATPANRRLALRVRPVKDSERVPRGLETEFGASVEVRVRGDVPGRVRRGFISSSHGYLQQSEYALTFGLPPGPDPVAPASGVVLDLVVDFPSRADRSLLRIDRRVNPALGGIDFATLADREITVFRSGVARIDGIDHAPTGPFDLRLDSTGRLALPDAGAPLPPLAPAPEASWFVGLEFDTLGTSEPTWLEELVLDGLLDDSARDRCGANVVLWDVTPGEVPRRVHQHHRTTSPRNARSFLRLSAKLAPHRVYRLLCRVKSLRGSPLAARTESTVTNHGGLSFANPNPCDGTAVCVALVRPDQAFLELRYRPAAGATRIRGVR